MTKWLGLGLGLPRLGRGLGRSATAPLRVFITADMDPANERDDEGAVALWLATQEHFEIVGFVADSPDGNIAQWTAITNAMDDDLQKLKTHSPYPERFKTAAQLQALGVQGATNNTVSSGATNDALAKGYWESGDSGYAQAHAAAQALITAAQTYGSAGGGPRDKLWVIVQGGWSTVAQAAREAVELGALPDFFSRIRIVGQPNYNSWAVPNCWNYLTANCWPSSGDPGLFGDMWVLCGYFKWHAHNRNNGGTDTTFWNTAITRGEMGAFLEAERAVSDFTQTYYRAGDAGGWFWLMGARLLDLAGDADPFNPENTSNPACVVAYRTYVGELWAAQTFGYGAGSGIQTGTPNPEHTWWNPTGWAPPTTVNDNTTDAYASINMTTWYNHAGEALERYGSANTTSTTALYMEGTRRASFNLTGPASTAEDTAASYSLAWIGPALTEPVTVTFTESNASSMTSTLAARLAAVSQTGVSSSGNSLIIGTTATSPVAFTRAPDDTIDGSRSYTIGISSVSPGSFVGGNITTSISDVGGYETEATDLFARMTVEPDSSRKALINDFIVAIKTDIGWAKFEGIYFFASHADADKGLNWRQDAYNATFLNSPTFLTDRYVETNGTDSYIEIPFNPATAGSTVYTQNSAHVAAWQVLDTVISHGSPWIGFNDDGAAPNTQITGRGSTGNFSYRINDGSTSNIGSQTVNIGLIAANRSASNARQAYRDGSSLGTSTTASTGLPNANLWIGRINTTYSLRRWTFCSFGQSLTSAEHTSLYNAVNTFLTGIGAV